MERETEAARLASLHDDALFARAYAPDAAAARAADRRLVEIAGRIAALPTAAKDAFDDPAISGAAGTAVAMSYSHRLALLLARRSGRDVRVDLDVVDEPERLGRLLVAARPLLAERGLVDANVDWVARLVASSRAARRDPLRFLLDGLGRLEAGERDRDRLWDEASLQLWWDVPAPLSRTFLRLPGATRFAFEGPLLGRRDVSLAREAASPSPRVGRVATSEGARLLELANLVLAVRYRELHAFAHGDPRAVLRADLGRGVTAWVTGLSPEARLPLRAGFGWLVATNGVPTGYGDAHALFGRLDLAFNVFPAFRAGESAYVFARVVRLLTKLTLTSSVHVDPFQIGLGNEEALSSGAFWFYRKQGFRCVAAEAEKLARREEARLALDPAHRTSRTALLRLAASGLAWDLPGAPHAAWDGFLLDRLLDRTASRTTRELVDEILPPRARSDAERRLVAAALREKESGAERRFLALISSLGRLRGAVRRAGS